MKKTNHNPNVTPEEYKARYKTLKTNERRARIRVARLKAVMKIMWTMFKKTEDYETLTGKRFKIIEEEVEE